MGPCDLRPFLHDGTLTCPILCCGLSRLLVVQEHIICFSSNPDAGVPAELRLPSSGLCIQRRGFPAVPFHSFILWTALFPTSSAPAVLGAEALSAHVGKEYFLFSAGKLEWVAPWKQSDKMTLCSLTHWATYSVSGILHLWADSANKWTLNISPSSKRNQLWKKRCVFTLVPYEQGGRYALLHLT